MKKELIGYRTILYLSLIALFVLGVIKIPAIIENPYRIMNLVALLFSFFACVYVIIRIRES